MVRNLKMSTIVVHIAYQDYVLGSMFGLINQVSNAESWENIVFFVTKGLDCIVVGFSSAYVHLYISALNINSCTWYKHVNCLYLQDEIKSAKVSQEDINVSIQAEL